MLKSGLQSIAGVIAGITKKHLHYFTWELWPSHILSKGYSQIWKDFLELFELLTDNKSDFSLEHAIKTGTVTYIEVARDIVNADKNSVIPWTASTKTGNIWKKNGAKGTIYVGSKDSHYQWAIYDKALQLIAKKSPSEYAKLLRVEARVRNPKISVDELDTLNPFKSLNIASVSKALALSTDKRWQGFIQTAVDHGAEEAFKSLTKHYRKLFRQNLTACAVNWWD